MDDRSKERIFFIVVSGFLLFFLVVRAALTLLRPLGPDEFQHLHATWMVAHGYLPYKDFWENHAPILYFLFSPLFQTDGNEIRGLFIMRGVLSILGLVILAQTFLLARKLHDTKVSLIAVLVLSYTVIYAQRTMEVRPDQLLVICWLAGLLVYLQALRRNQLLLYLCSGFLVGLGYLFSPKILMPFAALWFAALVCWFQQRSSLALFDLIKKHLILSLGFVIPIAASLLLFYRQGILRQFTSCVLLENFSYPDVRRPTYLLRIKYLSTLLLCLAGVVLHVKSLKRSPEKRVEKMMILVPTLFLLVVFLFFMPAAYPQSMLVFVPMLAIYGAEALMASFEKLSARGVSWKSVVPFGLALVAVMIPMGDVLLGKPFSSDNQDQLSRFRYVLNFSRPTERLFDAQSSYVFRPQSYYYGSLVAGNRERFPDKVLQNQIVNSLVSNHCRIIFQDDWISLLPMGLQSFLNDNYVPSLEPGILIAGKRIPLENAINSEISFKIAVPLKYSIRIEGDAGNLQIDGVQYNGPRVINQGEHKLSWTGNGSAAIIKATLPG